MHAYKYSHKCKARTPDEPVPQPEEPKPEKKKVANAEKLADSLKDVKGAKPSMTEKQSTKPIRQKSVIQRTPEYQPPEPPYQPTQQEMMHHFMQQRQQQAYLRHQAMLAPYQNMFARR